MAMATNEDKQRIVEMYQELDGPGSLKRREEMAVSMGIALSTLRRKVSQWRGEGLGSKDYQKRGLAAPRPDTAMPWLIRAVSDLAIPDELGNALIAHRARFYAEPAG